MKIDNNELFYALAQYLTRIDIQAENDLTQLYNNMSIRKATAYDHFELLQAHARQEAVQQIVGEIWILLANYLRK